MLQTPADLITLITAEAHIADEEERRVIAEWRQKHYTADKTDILEIISDAMVNFDAEDRDKMLKIFLRLVRKIIKRASMLYFKPPKRTILDDEKATEEYQKIIAASALNLAVKGAYRFAKLHNTVFTRVYPFDGKLALQNLTPDVCGVVENEENYLVPDVLYYDVSGYAPGSGVLQVRRVVWSSKYHFKIVANTKQSVGANEKDLNPYKELPAALLRLNSDKSDFWGTGADDLVLSVESLMTLAINLLEVCVMQGNDQAVAVNLNLDEERDSSGNITPVKMGPRRLWTADNIFDGVQRPGLDFASPSPEIAAIRETADWFIQQLASSFGLPKDAFADVETKVQSGVAKLYESAEMLEDREDEIQILQAYEQELYRKIAVVSNKEFNTDLPIDGVLLLDFAEPETFETAAEKKARREQEIRFNTKTPVDFIQEDNPDMTREDAEKRYKENLEFNDEFRLGEEYGRAKATGEVGAAQESVS